MFKSAGKISNLCFITKSSDSNKIRKIEFSNLYSFQRIKKKKLIVSEVYILSVERN